MSSLAAFVLVLEGPDAAGKSTLADAVEKVELSTGRTVYRIHNGPPDRNVTKSQLYSTYFLQLELALRRRDDNITTIIDRSFPSEAIYGQLRGGSLLSKRRIAKLEKFCAKHHILRFGFQTLDHVRAERMYLRGEPFKHQRAIGAAYIKYFQSHKDWITVSGSLATSTTGKP